MTQKKEKTVVLDNEGNEIRYKKKPRTWRERLTAGLFLSPSFFGIMKRPAVSLSLHVLASLE